VSVTYPSVDESLDRLHRAGWSVGDYGTATRSRRHELGLPDGRAHNGRGRRRTTP
jgi:hypothetical protein